MAPVRFESPPDVPALNLHHTRTGRKTIIQGPYGPELATPGRTNPSESPPSSPKLRRSPRRKNMRRIPTVSRDPKIVKSQRGACAVAGISAATNDEADDVDLGDHNYPCPSRSIGGSQSGMDNRPLILYNVYFDDGVSFSGLEASTMILEYLAYSRFIGAEDNLLLLRLKFSDLASRQTRTLMSKNRAAMSAFAQKRKNARLIITISTHADPQDGGLLYGDRKFGCLSMVLILDHILGPCEKRNIPLAHSLLFIISCGGFVHHAMQDIREARKETYMSAKTSSKRIQDACHRCRAKKIKCDAFTPRCMPCADTNSGCIRTKGDVGELQALRLAVVDLQGKVEQYERLLRILLPNSDLRGFSHGSSSSRTTSSPDLPFLPLIKSGEKAHNDNDLSHFKTLAENMGIVESALVHLMPTPIIQNQEDLTIGFMVQRIPGGILSQGCDSYEHEWEALVSTDGVPYSLPRNKDAMTQVLDCYFMRCHPSFPVVGKDQFHSLFEALHNQRESYDPSRLCVIQMVFAIGTLVLTQDCSVPEPPTTVSWPHHTELFVRASYLNVHMHPAVSSLQALLLIHQYLSLESPERNLWRFVGNITHLALELNLHRDPSTLPKFSDQAFSPEECRLRIRLWSIVLVLDRGTSLLLGRPCTISSGFDTPPPSTIVSKTFTPSPHFLASHVAADIHAHVISMYAFDLKDWKTIAEWSALVLQEIDDFHQSLPRTYSDYFSSVFQDFSATITEAEILTLLKISFSRMLLARVVFLSEWIPYEIRQSALEDAMMTAHNSIVLEAMRLSLPRREVHNFHIQLYSAILILLYGFQSLGLEADCQVDCETLLPVIRLAYEILPRTSLREDATTGQPFFAQMVETFGGIQVDSLEALHGWTLFPQPGWRVEGLAEADM
ncbi:hypothetical protein Hypma_016613 [Hypsizygus marmoreus]|uniref:Zn(2)-C6 fungal-type domain-containing protein n=1 Tax=Hypsizygus marmoreus TaxID=39966 RepID=A0A369IXR5_HYPMA|nr:hypothetical protein Hypma_016613 [Hypsizygus marmoreus]